MYTYVRSLVLNRAANAQWEEAQLATTKLFDIYNQFSKIIHVVTHPSYQTELYIDFTSLRSQILNLEVLLSAWFTSIADTALPLLDHLPTSRINYIQYMDANQAGYVAQLDKIGVNVPENYPKSALPDISLTRPLTDTDCSLLHTKGLVTINGYLHLTDTDGSKLYVKDAGKSLNASGLNNVGIISFAKLADIKKILCSNNMISGETNRPLYETLDIKLPELIGNRSFMLSLGGYLITAQAGLCWQVGDDIIRLNLALYPFIHRFIESRRYLDLSSLGMTIDLNDPGAFNPQELISDTVIRKYMTLSQTFVILINSPNLFTRKLYIEHMGVPGLFTTQQEPMYPLITGYGKLSDYWKREEDGYWAVSIVDGPINNYILDYRSMDDLEVLNDSRLPGRTYDRTQGFLLEIGTYA